MKQNTQEVTIPKVTYINLNLKTDVSTARLPALMSKQCTLDNLLEFLLETRIAIYLKLFEMTTSDFIDLLIVE